MWGKIKNTILYFFYIVLFVGLALEIILRIFNPIPVRLKGDAITLPINQNYSFTNEYPCFDSLIVHQKNSLGFRGAELPEGRETQKVIAIGGSTTECFFISEDKVWTQVLQDSLSANQENEFWVNNAGLNGHSTFGHNILLTDIIVPLEPDYVLFLVGVNDMDRADLNDFDKRYLNDADVAEKGGAWYRNTLLNLAKKSELINLFYNLSKALKAQKQQIFVDKVIALNPSDTLALEAAYVSKVLQEQEALLPAYKSRLDSLVVSCLDNEIKPVLITQPLLFGFGKDPISSTDLAKAKVFDGMNGQLYWEKLELYNDVTRNTAKQYGIPLIDLAATLPKSNEYFYDAMHYTNAGSIKVGQLIHEGFSKVLLEE